MAEVMDMPLETLDRSRDRQSERREKTESSPPPHPPPIPPRRRDRDSRERRDERDDRPINRRADYHRSPGRDRDYKRRHSPPRRSPPPFKRSRRDDGGYDNRRGSPRGGFGSDDRRFGYDYAGGYDRGPMAGRLGYPDERPHSRYMNRPSGGYQSGPSDWPDSGRAGFGDISNTGPTQREGLMSYKQFIQVLEDDILPAEAERRYQEYRSEYISTQKRAYFEAHKDEEWLKDKYHPTNLIGVIERRNEQARALAKEFLLDLQSGKLDLGPGVTASSSSLKLGQGSDPNSEDDADTGGKRRRHGRGPAKENDLLSAAPKAHPVSSAPRRIQVDVEQAQALVRKLDKEKGIEENILYSVGQDKLEGGKPHSGSMGPIIIIRGLTTVKGLEGIELLDTLMTYLWRIHGLDYYGTSETNEVKGKGLRHVRAEGKSHDETNAGGADWEKKVDSFWQGRLHGQDPLEKMTAKEKIDAAAAEALDPHVRKIRDEKYGWKYGCGAKGCTKLFHAAEFVHKHLKLKHPELILELTSKVREDLYFENYMNDPDAPGGTPVMQQPVLKDKSQRRRPSSDNIRLRDDRGGRRELDRIDRINDEESPLGPFVPAPPEVAMRMLRDQGGPSPYEANGGSRGRKGRSGPQMGGPGPIISFSPAFQQDPRRIRSYQDLDAPEDEVTVIDYRSL
ncbi:serrate RNA effector molecule-like isoform X2 [Tasmannia lanceolata]|uniref:serrate RNA effector molecule-like isoform X2 n=1 Tax=Tasmannia lanceolata TaxID=3420 RepID=UPI004064358E